MHFQQTNIIVILPLKKIFCDPINIIYKNYAIYLILNEKKINIKATSTFILKNRN